MLLRQAFPTKWKTIRMLGLAHTYPVLNMQLKTLSRSVPQRDRAIPSLRRLIQLCWLLARGRRYLLMQRDSCSIESTFPVLLHAGTSMQREKEGFWDDTVPYNGAELSPLPSTLQPWYEAREVQGGKAVSCSNGLQWNRMLPFSPQPHPVGSSCGNFGLSWARDSPSQGRSSSPRVHCILDLISTRDWIGQEIRASLYRTSWSGVYDMNM